MILTLVKIVGSTASSYIFLSLAEWFLHRYFMHKRASFALQNHSDFLRSTHYRHAVQHHGIYYKDFSHEPDPIGRYISIYPDFVFTAIAAVPFVAILFQLSQILAAVFSAVLVSHHLIWMLAHKEMHIPSNMFFRNWLPYKWLARNHWMHHKYRNVNYNLVFPLADLLFGTYKSPNPRDREQMSKSGL
jgi:hypothetical protein